MSESLHIVCPHCHTTNRVRADQLGSSPTCGQCKQALFTAHSVALDEAAFDKHVARQAGAMGAADIVRWAKAHQSG